MTKTDPPSTPQEWINHHGSYGFRWDDLSSAIVLNGSNDNIVLLSSPPTGVPLVLNAGTGRIVLSLQEQHLDRVLIAGDVELHGSGQVEYIGAIPEDVSRPADSAIAVDGPGLHVGQIDCRGIPNTIIHLLGEVIELIAGDGRISPVAEPHVQRLSVVGPALHLYRALSTNRITSSSAFTIEGGRLQTGSFEAGQITLERATLRIVGSQEGGKILVNETAKLELIGADATLENVELSGCGVVLVDRARLIAPVFDEKGLLRLEAVNDAEVSLVTGPVQLNAHSGAVVSGSADGGLIITELTGVDPAGIVANPEGIESVNFFRLDPARLSDLAKADRVSAWWPEPRTARSRARAIDCGVRSETSRPLARARYWTSVERLLVDKDASGRDVAIAHDVAEDARRLAASWKHPERVWLEFSRAAGYGARVGEPLLAWCAVAALVALLIRQLAGGGICFACSFDSGIQLYWDVLVSPVNFVRPFDEATRLSEMTADHLGARMVAFFGRAFGTWMLVASALALRRYLRTS